MKTISVALLLFCLACTPSVQSETPTIEVIPQSYKECAAMGGKLLKTFPGKCVYKYGETFLDDSKTGKICKDMCGDGICQEIVCMGSGCPCAESVGSCGGDCK